MVCEILCLLCSYSDLFCNWQSKSDRDMVVDMGKYVDMRIRVRFQGGREGII